VGTLNSASNQWRKYLALHGGGPSARHLLLLSHKCGRKHTGRFFCSYLLTTYFSLRRSGWRPATSPFYVGVMAKYFFISRLMTCPGVSGLLAQKHNFNWVLDSYKSRGSRYFGGLQVYLLLLRDSRTDDTRYSLEKHIHNRPVGTLSHKIDH